MKNNIDCTSANRVLQTCQKPGINPIKTNHHQTTNSDVVNNIRQGDKIQRVDIEEK